MDVRQPLVVGNWKLNGNKAMIQSLIEKLKSAIREVSGCQVAIAPPVPYLPLAEQLLGRNKQIILAAQNADIRTEGAFTGDISPSQLQEFGVKMVIIGHSERRQYHQESGLLIAKKFTLLQKLGLTPVLCIGESEEDRLAGNTEEYCATQLDSITALVGEQAFRQAVIAYEPIWAIGTGKAATPEEAQEVHHFIRQYVARRDPLAAAEVQILYGGSVTALNAPGLFQMADIDGALVGGASLKAETFSSIVKSAARRY